MTLLLGLAPRRPARACSSRRRALAHARRRGRRSSIWQFGENKSLVEGALRVDDLALSLDFIFYAAAALALVLSLRDPRHERTRASATTSALLLTSVTGHGRARRRRPT